MSQEKPLEKTLEGGGLNGVWEVSKATFIQKDPSDPCKSPSAVFQSGFLWAIIDGP